MNDVGRILYLDMVPNAVSQDKTMKNLWKIQSPTIKPFPKMW